MVKAPRNYIFCLLEVTLPFGAATLVTALLRRVPLTRRLLPGER